MLMVIFIKATGKMEKPTAMESSLILTVACTKVNGLTINNMAMEQNRGTTKKLNIPESSMTAKKQAKVASNSKEDTTKVISKMENLTAREFITFLILVKFTRVILRKIICMDKELWFGQMNLGIQVSSKWVRLKVEVQKNLQMEIDMLVIGKTISSMEVESGTV
jgi:hypothetical protein